MISRHRQSGTTGPWSTCGTVCLTLPIALAVLSGSGGAEDVAKTVLKTEQFDRDPGWEGHNRHIVPKLVKAVEQDFGFSAETSHAGGRAGEVGGMIWRSGAYGYYADRVGPLWLADRLEASGKVVLSVGPPWYPA